VSAHAILIVDDSRYLPEVLTRQLRDRGYKVRSVHSIDDALIELRRAEPPTFILADRMLDEPIEVRNLARLCDAAPQSKVLVYTAQELTLEQQNTIQSRGAYRVLDKSAVEQLSDDITLLIQEFDELLESSAQLQEATTERSRIVAAFFTGGSNRVQRAWVEAYVVVAVSQRSCLQAEFLVVVALSPPCLKQANGLIGLYCNDEPMTGSSGLPCSRRPSSQVRAGPLSPCVRRSIGWVRPRSLDCRSKNACSILPTRLSQLVLGAPAYTEPSPLTIFDLWRPLLAPTG
jgi:ActR/RegA family two-component response regulator